MGRKKGGKSRYYSSKFKQNVIKELLNGESTRSLAAKYEMDRSNISRWIKQYKSGGFKALENKRKSGNPYSSTTNKKNPTEVEILKYELAKAEVEIVKLKKRLEIQRKEESQKK